MYLITLSRSNIQILTNILISSIYSRNISIYSLFISFFVLVDEKRFEIYIKIVFVILYTKIIDREFDIYKYLNRYNKLAIDK